MADVFLPSHMSAFIVLINYSSPIFRHRMDSVRHWKLPVGRFVLSLLDNRRIPRKG